VEGWHRSINEYIGCKHPSLYRFLENIIEVQGLQEMRIAKIESGEEPEKKIRIIYRDYESRLKTLVQGYRTDFSKDDLVRYIRSIATVLNFDITSRKKVEEDEDEEME
jgi:hypothetical protein